MDHEHHKDEATLRDYVIFIGIILFVFISAWIISKYAGFSLAIFLRFFMAMFFLVFGLFKLLDLPGFVMSYIGYDIVARKYTAYAYAYPFIELALAAGYFLNLSFIEWPTLVLMIIGSIGVMRQLMRGSKIKCACLGTYVKLPLTTVSLIEDLSMGIMALVLLVLK
jgi:hypothetical protein